MKQRQKGTNKAMKLNPKQHLAITHLITGRSIDQAAKESGVSDRTLSRWLNLPEFRAELEKRLNLQVEEAFGHLRKVAGKAVEKLAFLMDSGNDFVALRACKEILERALEVVEIEALKKRLERLEQLVAQNDKPKHF